MTTDHERRRVRAPWRTPQRFPAAWAASGAILLALALGVFPAWQDAWRAETIGVLRHARPEYPDHGDRDLPLLVLFAQYRENPAAGAIAVDGRMGDGPELTFQRLARLLGMLASLPEKYRPLAIGIDLVLSPDAAPASTAYLAAALSRLNAVVLSATEDSSQRDGVRRALPILRERAAEGIDTFTVPSFAPASSAPRLRARIICDLPREETSGAEWTGFAYAVAMKANPDAARKYRLPAELPIHYWSLYAPGSAATERSGERLAGLWPDIAALELTHAAPANPAGEWKPVIPLWQAGEPPDSWLLKVKEALEGKDADGIAWQDNFGPSVAGRILLIGAGQPLDLTPTPFTSRLYRSEWEQGGRPPLSPGVMLQALAVATILKHNAPRDWSVGLGLYFALFFSAAAGWMLGMLFSPRRALAAFAVLILVFAAGDALFCEYANVWLPVVAAICSGSLWFAAATMTSWMLVRESRDRTARWVRRLLPRSAGEAIESGSGDFIAPEGALESGSGSAWRTVLLADMAGYTEFVRALELRGEPGLALELISDFVTRTVPCLDRRGGRITDLTGDGMAVLFDGDDASAQARAALDASVDVIGVFREWRITAAVRSREAGIGRIKVPGLRIGLGASETQFRFVGTAEQQKPLYFGGAFILAARIEAALKNLALPPGANPVHRLAMEQAVAARLGPPAGLPVTLAPAVRLSLKGLDGEVGIVEAVLPGA
ncbi:hypothetical protein BH09SUM1_BH09SUM1_09620 [soil metagenome]